MSASDIIAIVALGVSVPFSAYAALISRKADRRTVDRETPKVAVTVQCKREPLPRAMAFPSASDPETYYKLTVTVTNRGDTDETVASAVVAQVGHDSVDITSGEQRPLMRHESLVYAESAKRVVTDTTEPFVVEVTLGRGGNPLVSESQTLDPDVLAEIESESE